MKASIPNLYLVSVPTILAVVELSLKMWKTGVQIWIIDWFVNFDVKPIKCRTNVNGILSKKLFDIT